MTTIMCLPDEAIAIILSYNDLSIEDIVNFRCVWMQLRLTAKYDKYWEIIFFQRWPSAKKLYDKQFKENEQVESEENEQNNKKRLNFMETGINCARQLRKYVSQKIQTYYNDNKSIDNLTKYGYVFRSDKDLRNNLGEILYKPEYFIKYSFFIDELKNLLSQSPRRTGCDLTERYCNIKLFHYMRQCLVQKKWYRFEEQPLKDQLLERVATFVAQWIQPQKDIFYSYVKASLDNIAQEVLNFLREKHPYHSIFSTYAETFSYWRNNNIDDNHWDEEEGTKILGTLVEYIFGKLHFRTCRLKNRNLQYMCIDNVLKNKCGQEVIVLIICHSVARRLGLHCEIVKLRFSKFHSRIRIFWKSTYATNSLENVRCFNIKFEKFPDCHVNRRFYRTFVLTANWMRHKMIEIVTDLTYNYNNTSRIRPISGYVRGKRELLSLSFNKRTYFIRRSKDVKFAVGMIVSHRVDRNDRSTNSCAGVIIGWHRHIDGNVKLCIDNGNDLDTYTNIGFLPWKHCRNIKFKKQQTNYIILTDNNNICYVEEDTIFPTTNPKWIDNSEIGRYFCKLEGTHYVPNKMLAKLYP